MKAQGYTRETIQTMGTERPLPKFRAGDTIRVAEHIKEGDKERIQYFEGDVIGIHKRGISATVTVRRIGANSVAVERIFPLHSTKFDFEFIREGDVRRAKLYYLRGRIGKSARVQERVRSHEEKTRIEAAALELAEEKTESPQQDNA